MLVGLCGSCFIHVDQLAYYVLIPTGQIYITIRLFVPPLLDTFSRSRKMISSLHSGEYAISCGTLALISSDQHFLIDLAMDICLIILLKCVYPIYNNSFFCLKT